MIRSATLRMCGVLLLCGAVLAGCSSSSSSFSSVGSPVDGTGGSTTTGPSTSGGGSSTSALDGKWDGAWKDSANDTGSFSVNFSQNGSSLNGTLSIAVTCLDGAKVTGHVNGSEIEFGSVQGECEVDYKGTVNGDQMSGTYDISGAGGAGGTWKAAKA
jgi:hypothetical protein